MNLYENCYIVRYFAQFSNPRLSKGGVNLKDVFEGAKQKQLEFSRAVKLKTKQKAPEYVIAPLRAKAAHYLRKQVQVSQTPLVNYLQRGTQLNIDRWWKKITLSKEANPR